MSSQRPILKRILAEIKLLQTNAEVQSYFHYEKSENEENFKRFCIYGYLLPQTEPYKYGSYKVRITLPFEFPFKPPEMSLLTYIYHPAVTNDIHKPKFCTKCYNEQWQPCKRISQWIKCHIDVIDQPGDEKRYCLLYTEAYELYLNNLTEYNNKALEMVKKYAHPRPDQSIISLKFTVKQMIRKQLEFESTKIDQLQLPICLKQYLKSSLDQI